MKKLPLLILSLTLALSSCNKSFTSFEQAIVCSPKPVSGVEVRILKPDSYAICIGNVKSVGVIGTSQEEVVKDCQTQGADMGADFLLLVISGDAYGLQKNTGHNTADMTAAIALANGQDRIFGFAEKRELQPLPGSKVLPKNMISLGFTAWVYLPTTTGLKINSEGVVTGFQVGSRAEAIGVRVGDELSQINGINLTNPDVLKILQQKDPEIILGVIRNGEPLEFKVNTVTYTF